jgi:hypothetical protein
MHPFLTPRRSQKWLLTGACALAVSALLAVPSDAHACGGCFVGPSPVDSTVVTGHRMVLSISTKETTLYDQIKYAGNPSSFAWVLPIRGKAKIGVSADTVFTALDNSTRTQILAPPQNCPPPPNCPSRSAFGAAANESVADASSAVEVLAQETVGPYETVQLAASNANALSDWLGSHGYTIPDDIKPLIATYVSEGFDFLALKLVPGAGVSAMRPVRITTTGAQPSLPLRMVAAGTGVNVGITLWVIGDGRWEPQTFPSFFFVANDLSWNWAKSSSDIADKRAAKIAELGAAAWEIESSIELPTQNLSYQISSAGYGRLPDGGYGPLSPYDPVLNDAGVVTETSDAVAADDLEALFQHRTTSRVTRMASTLPRASLATDLALQASADQSTIANFRQLTHEIGEPQCQVYSGCDPDGFAPRSVAQARASDGWGSGGCRVPPSSSNEGAGAASASLLALMAMAIGSRFRRRNQR